MIQRFTTLALALALVTTGTSVARAAPTLEVGMGGPNDFGTMCLSPNDDGSSNSISLATAFPSGLNFFGTTYDAVYVNTNGNITFGGGLGQFTPSPFPIADQPMIAPWWADEDTRGGGQPMRNNICFYVEPNRIVVTWNNVGYFSSHDDLQNDFQLILTTSNTCSTTGDFDVEFRYTDMH